MTACFYARAGSSSHTIHGKPGVVKPGAEPGVRAGSFQATGCEKGSQLLFDFFRKYCIF
jgi:hypothetical protein